MNKKNAIIYLQLLKSCSSVFKQEMRDALDVAIESLKESINNGGN